MQHCVMVPTFLLQNIYHPRTSESLPPNYNMPPERRPELHQRIRVIRHDDVRTGSGESRSELLIQQTSPNDNGTYYCEAVNKAASSVSNFTLHVTDSVDAPTILQVRNFTVVEITRNVSFRGKIPNFEKMAFFCHSPDSSIFNISLRKQPFGFRNETFVLIFKQCEYQP